jgi:hypothetical protein
MHSYTNLPPVASLQNGKINDVVIIQTYTIENIYLKCCALNCICKNEIAPAINKHSNKAWTVARMRLKNVCGDLLNCCMQFRNYVYPHRPPIPHRLPQADHSSRYPVINYNTSYFLLLFKNGLPIADDEE